MQKSAPSSSQGPAALPSSATPASANGTTAIVVSGTTTRLTKMASGWIRPVSTALAGAKTAAMASCASTAERTHDPAPRGRERGAKNASSTATAPNDSQNPGASGAIGSSTSTTASA